MKNYMGEELQLWIGSGSTAHTLACATSLSVNTNADTIDVGCKDTGRFGASIAGKISWDISTDCLFVTEDVTGTTSGHSSAYAELMDALIAGTPLLATWSTVANYQAANAAGGDADGHVFNDKTKAEDAKDLYYGYVVLTSVSLTADNGSVATYSVSAQGKGAINRSKNNATK